jgi:hypothetical protein
MANHVYTDIKNRQSQKAKKKIKITQKYFKNKKMCVKGRRKQEKH